MTDETEKPYDATADLVADVPDQRVRKVRRTVRKPRCPTCGYYFTQIKTWICPRCQHDLRETGFIQPRTTRQRLAAFFRALGRRLRRRPRSGVACGKCEYPARGIVGFHCPECGSDLREVGIIDQDRMSKRGVIMLVTTMWAGIVVVAAMLLSDWVASWAIPQQVSSYETIRLASDNPAFIVHIEGTGHGTRWYWQSPPRIGKFTINLHGVDGKFAAVIEAQLFGIYEVWYSGISESKVGHQFNGDVLAQAMRHIGLDTDDPSVTAKGQEIIQILLALQDDRAKLGDITRFEATGRRSTQMKPDESQRVLIPLYWLSFGLFFPALWAAALVWKHRIRRGTSVKTTTA